MNDDLVQFAADEATGKLPAGTDVSVLTSDLGRWRRALLGSNDSVISQLGQIAANLEALKVDPGDDPHAVADLMAKRHLILRFKAKIDARLREVKDQFQESDTQNEIRSVTQDRNVWRRTCVWLVGQLEDLDDIVADAPAECRDHLEDAIRTVDAVARAVA